VEEGVEEDVRDRTSFSSIGNDYPATFGYHLFSQFDVHVTSPRFHINVLKYGMSRSLYFQIVCRRRMYVQ